MSQSLKVKQAQWYREHLPLKGAVVADVGANVGYFSRIFWEACGPDGRVVSVEPLPANIKRLEKEVRKAGAKNWSIRRCAVSDHDGEVELVEERTEGVRNSVVAPGAEGARAVTCRRLSRLVPDATVVKLDIEGHEYAVLPDALPELPGVRAWALELHMVSSVPLPRALALLLQHDLELLGGALAADDPDGPWLAVPLDPNTRWDMLPGSQRGTKTLHVIARKR